MLAAMATTATAAIAGPDCLQHLPGHYAVDRARLAAERWDGWLRALRAGGTPEGPLLALTRADAAWHVRPLDAGSGRLWDTDWALQPETLDRPAADVLGEVESLSLAGLLTEAIQRPPPLCYVLLREQGRTPPSLAMLLHTDLSAVPEAELDALAACLTRRIGWRATAAQLRDQRWWLWLALERVPVTDARLVLPLERLVPP